MLLNLQMYTKILRGPEYQGYDAAQAQASQMDAGLAPQAELAELGQAQGYDAQGYTAAQNKCSGFNERCRYRPYKYNA